MLPRINRIKRKKDFEFIFKNSRIFRNSLFIFRIGKNNLGLNRFGFIISQKVSKKATIRNRIRRRLAEVIKLNADKIKVGTDLVLIVLPLAGKKEFIEIKEAINNSLIKSNLI